MGKSEETVEKERNDTEVTSPKEFIHRISTKTRAM